MEYKNPIPIAVALVRAYDPFRGVSGILLIRRASGKYAGMLALPAGYMEFGETWQESVVRELREETGIEADARHVVLHEVMTSPLNGFLLVFGLVQDVRPNIAELKPTPEASEYVVVGKGELFETQFDTHVAAVRKFFSDR